MSIGFRLMDQLQINLTDESKAYGYTLAIWGSGASLINAFGFPAGLEVMLYVFGAVVGFGLLAVSVYGAMFGAVPNLEEEEMVVASMIHLLAALGTVGMSIVIAQELPAQMAFFLAGVNASVTYNLLLLAEVALSRQIASRPWRRSTRHV